VPDGAANWIDPDATPGEPNNAFVSTSGAARPVQFPSRPMFRQNLPVFTIVVLPLPSPVEPPPSDEQITTDEKAKPEEPAITNVEAPQTDSRGPDGDLPPENPETPTDSVGAEILPTPEPTPEAPTPPAEIIPVETPVPTPESTPAPIETSPTSTDLEVEPPNVEVVPEVSE